MYWELYAAEAELNDQKLVQTLTGDTKSMVILVSSDASALQTASLILWLRTAFSPQLSRALSYKLPRLFNQTTAKKPSVYYHSLFPLEAPLNHYPHSVLVLTLRRHQKGLFDRISYSLSASSCL